MDGGPEKNRALGPRLPLRRPCICPFDQRKTRGRKKRKKKGREGKKEKREGGKRKKKKKGREGGKKEKKKGVCDRSADKCRGASKFSRKISKIIGFGSFS